MGKNSAIICLKICLEKFFLFMSGVLYLVATPIGNLEDITLRALKTLNESSIVLAENTKTSQKLFSAHGINSKLVSFNDFSSNTKIVSLLRKLKGGDSISLISDAGTPLISDPGFNLVSHAIDELSLIHI